MNSTTIATRTLIAERANGERFDLRIRVGLPYEAKNDDWACPVGVEGIDAILPDLHGVDSWQALLLAVNLVRARLGYFLKTGGRLYWADAPTEPLDLTDIFGRDT